MNNCNKIQKHPTEICDRVLIAGVCDWIGVTWKEYLPPWPDRPDHRHDCSRNAACHAIRKPYASL